jgi:MoaA/NifB/PqqE/SkfB family radical SAM enzyme
MISQHSLNSPVDVELVQIEPTTRCNFSCEYCCGRRMPQRDMSFEAFARILDSLPNLRHIEIQGEGEPMLHDRFLDMVALTRARGIEVSFICNGSLLEPRRVARILDLGVRKVAVSIDSATADVFREIRGGDLRKVVRGIETLLTARNERRLDRPLVGFQITLLRRTRNSLPDIIRLYRRLGLDGGFGLQPLQHMDTYLESYSETMKEQMLGEDEIAQFYADHEVLLTEMRRERRKDLQGYYDELFDGWDPASGTCPWLEKAAYVTYEGHYTPCCTIKETLRYGFPTVEIFDRIGISKIRTSLAADLREGWIPRPCRGCAIANQIAAFRGGNRQHNVGHESTST